MSGPGGNGKGTHIHELRAFLAQPDPRFANLTARLSAQHWTTRQLAQPERFLGDLVMNTSRVFIVGSTGVGKTMVGFGFAVGMASGQGFLHWRSPRPLRVLYVDGEMACDLVQQRLKAEIMRTHGEPYTMDNLMVYSRDDAEALAHEFPGLGQLAPLNTAAGLEFMQRLCADTQPDVVIFDNVQSLLVGSLREEETWEPAKDLVLWLTTQRIAQVWIDHTGWDNTRQYGSATKAWQFDTVGIVTALAEELRIDGELAFTLSFDPPGKARRRTPENWHEFVPHIIRLREGRWVSETTAGKVVTDKKLAPSRVLYFDALKDAVVAAPGPRPHSAHEDAWVSECVRKGLLDRAEGKDWLKSFRTAKSELLRADFIGIDSKIVTILHHK